MSDEEEGFTPWCDSTRRTGSGVMAMRKVLASIMVIVMLAGCSVGPSSKVSDWWKHERWETKKESVSAETDR